MAAPWPPGSCPRRARCEAFGWGLELWGGARQWMRRRGLSGPAVLGAPRTSPPMMGRREAPVGSGEALARRGAATELQTELLGSRLSRGQSRRARQHNCANGRGRGVYMPFVVREGSAYRISAVPFFLALDTVHSCSRAVARSLGRPAVVPDKNGMARLSVVLRREISGH